MILRRARAHAASRCSRRCAVGDQGGARAIVEAFVMRQSGKAVRRPFQELFRPHPQVSELRLWALAGRGSVQLRRPRVHRCSRSRLPRGPQEGDLLRLSILAFEQPFRALGQSQVGFADEGRALVPRFLESRSSSAAVRHSRHRRNLQRDEAGRPATAGAWLSSASLTLRVISRKVRSTGDVSLARQTRDGVFRCLT